MTSQKAAAEGLVTPQMLEQYQSEGYFILHNALRDEQLQLLRDEAQFAMEKIDREMEASGVDRLGINARGRRYFSSIYRERPALREFLFSDLMGQICRATLGDNAYLFHEQYVIKAGDRDTAFAWHQDSGYVHEDHQPYVTCWIALDDVTEDNGSVYLLPYSQSGIRSYIKHVESPVVNDKVCYFGTNPGVPVTASAGSIAVFSSVVIHRSGANLTDHIRRVYLAQYSGEIITAKDGKTPWSSYEQILRDGDLMAPTGTSHD